MLGSCFDCCRNAENSLATACEKISKTERKAKSRAHGSIKTGMIGTAQVKWINKRFFKDLFCQIIE